jgi:N-methylhydantoinase A
VERAPVSFGGKIIPAAVFARDKLAVGKKYSGPAIVTEYSATTVVPPGMRFWLDRAGNIQLITKRPSNSGAKAARFSS